MRSAQAFLRLWSPPLLVVHKKRKVANWDSCSCSTFTSITTGNSWFPSSAHLTFQQSVTAVNILAPHYSRRSHFYQEEDGDDELGFKKKEENHSHDNNSKDIIASHPFTNTQDKYSTKPIGLTPDESQPNNPAFTLHFVSQFSSSSNNGKKSVKEEEDEEVGLHMERASAVKDEDRGLQSATGVRHRQRQLMKRSTMIAKQVISIQSALSLGFVSQLWVDPNAWLVLIVEVKPNLLSGDLERFFLHGVAKVGDVVLVEDESVMENDFKLVGLETLVGYTVVTPGRQNIGKVRGFTFNINSGAVESLELDSFGISIIPSSLVRTYALFVEDVMEVLPDTIVVHEAAASRVQRLSKGFWVGAGQKMEGSSVDEFEECGDYEGGSRKKNLSSRKFPGEGLERADDWELPMDYL